MSMFRFTLDYMPGISNHIVDLLSRPNGVNPPPKVNSNDLQGAGNFFEMDFLKCNHDVSTSWCRSDFKPVKRDIDKFIPEERAVLEVSTQKAFDDEPLWREMDIMAQRQIDDPVIS